MRLNFFSVFLRRFDFTKTRLEDRCIRPNCFQYTSWFAKGSSERDSP